ncbi:MAG: enoyl-CoA hydratase/isomerase family protein [Myxococcales bacterium]|nr:enoyl-CoA hydratase/isomerase family protein [Myxococcales bacterium]
MEAARDDRPVLRSVERDGALVRLTLSRPKANVLDAPMVSALRGELAWLQDEARDKLKLIVFEGAGKHFSFGASVEEHLPGKVGQMLNDFHAMFRELEALAVPTAAVVRGQCLGGGLELALFCGRVFAEPSARFGVPEIKLGVFPPMGALLLPWRVCGSRATELVLGGESLTASEAFELGLVESCDDNAEAALAGYFETQLAPRSSVGLRYAWRAARLPMADRLERDLPRLERLYLDELMRHEDPVEGLNAFLERREPVWRGV